jgi:hypothetical protein
VGTEVSQEGSALDHDVPRASTIPFHLAYTRRVPLQIDLQSAICSMLSSSSSESSFHASDRTAVLVTRLGRESAGGPLSPDLDCNRKVVPLNSATVGRDSAGQVSTFSSRV